MENSRKQQEVKVCAPILPGELRSQLHLIIRCDKNTQLTPQESLHAGNRGEREKVMLPPPHEKKKLEKHKTKTFLMEYDRHQNT